VHTATARLLLRPFTPADAAAMHEIYRDPEVMRYVGHGPVRRRSQTEGMLAGYMRHQEAHGFSFWAVVESETGAVIGDAGLFLHGGRGPEVELGYTLGRAWWGRGYATEAAGAWLDQAFGRLALEEVIALAEPANTGSLHVLEKLGMTADGMRAAFGRPHAVYRIRRSRL
jgi:[ribosomal protein S5]-alanine N-acetyltransferase